MCVEQHPCPLHPDCSALAQLLVCRYSEQFWNNEAWSPNPQRLYEFKVDWFFTFVAVSFSSFLWMCFQVMDLCDWNLHCHTMHLWFKEQNNFFLKRQHGQAFGYLLLDKGWQSTHLPYIRVLKQWLAFWPQHPQREFMSQRKPEVLWPVNVFFGIKENKL